MQRKNFLRLIVGILALMAVTLVLCGSAWAQGTYKTLHRFNGGKDGNDLQGGLIFDALGNLYGTTNTGGAYGDGTVFELLPNTDGTWKEKVLHNFNGKGGAQPQNAGVVLDAQGNLYGTTMFGGKGDCHGYGCGVVYELIPNTDGSWKFKVLHYFSGSVGVNPSGGFVFDATGSLYGTTTDWSYDYTGPGTVYKLTPNADGSWTKSTLFTFNNTDGYNPSNGVIFDPTGSLYGTTVWGGQYGDGVIFQLAPNADGSWTESVLYNFTGGSDGMRAWVRPIRDSSGNLFGQTTWGGLGYGVIWKLTPNGDGSWTENTLYTFKGARGGTDPWGQTLALDSAGNVYGTADSGGAGGCGLVFKLTPTTEGPWNETAIHTFRDRPGCGSNGSLIFDAAGNLYGTTHGDGSKTFGSVFEITP